MEKTFTKAQVSRMLNELNYVLTCQAHIDMHAETSSGSNGFTPEEEKKITEFDFKAWKKKKLK